MISRLHRITINSEQCGGRPCLRGLRIRVADVLSYLAAGSTYEEILEAHPDLERDDILAAIEYAAAQTGNAIVRVA